MFAPLPSSMVKLESAIQQLDDPGIPPPPPDMLEMGERLRLIYARARADAYANLGRSEVRKLPFAYWVRNAPVLTQVEAKLVADFWQLHLPEALSASPRRAKRWLAPLYFVYCERFVAGDFEFQAFASKLLTSVQLAQGLFAQKLQSLQSAHRFFTPSEVPNRLARFFFLDRGKSIDALLEELQLWSGFFASNFGAAIFKAGLGLPSESMRDAQTVHRLLDWAKRGSVSVVKSDLRVPFANALLGCWAGQKPPDSLKNVLVDYFIAQYGDPRFQNHLHYQWDGVSAQAQGVILNWLTGDTLRGFMKLLQRTADDIWRYRQKFWMAYYERGYIDEAWMALGGNAQWMAQSLKMDQKGMGFGLLDGGAASNQSVLLLKIGDLVFTEWSHNGSLRAYKDGSLQAPSLYQRTYNGTDLRAATSLDFHDAANMNPELRHMNSEGGTWQRKARDFIRRRTNVYINDTEIL